MKLESLPNELLLDLFNYMDGTDLFRVFFALNSRFNQLLYQQFLSYRFSFYYISKKDFDTICQKHLPLITNQILAFKLSDLNTVKQIDLFLYYAPSFKQFTHLKSLKINHLSSYQTLLNLLDECQNLPQLIRLHFYSCYLQDSSVDSQLIINRIWSLSKLTDCFFHIRPPSGEPFYLPTIISTSLERLAINFFDIQWNDMYQLIQYTPHLKKLLVTIKSFTGGNNTAETTFPTLTSCYLSLEDDVNTTIINFIIQSMPNLRHLTIRIKRGLIINGYDWEHIIQNYLPNLKTFRLTMQQYFPCYHDIKMEADRLCDSFRTPFWINERKWFLWCLTEGSTIYICTRPNASKYYKHIVPDSWISTCPDDNQQEFYSHTTTINDGVLFDKIISPGSNTRLTNIEYLSVTLPVSDQFHQVIPSLKRLKTLLIFSYADIYQSQVESIFDRISHLDLLHISQNASLPVQMLLFNYENLFVRRFKFHGDNVSFDTDQCLILIHSQLCNQCEELSIQVTNRQCIIILVENMINLRSLIVKSADNQYKKTIRLTIHNDELTEWLKEHLSSSYTIVRNPVDPSNILIWM